jgi:hypothetical protein
MRSSSPSMFSSPVMTAADFTRFGLPTVLPETG